MRREFVLIPKRTSKTGQYFLQQRCVMSLILFNIYLAAIFQDALENVKKGIKENEVWIKNIRYADDTA